MSRHVVPGISILVVPEGQICSSPILQAPKTVTGVHIEIEPTGAPPFQDIPPTPLRPCSLPDLIDQRAGPLDRGVDVADHTALCALRRNILNAASISWRIAFNGRAITTLSSTLTPIAAVSTLPFHSNAFPTCVPGPDLLILSSPRQAAITSRRRPARSHQYACASGISHQRARRKESTGPDRVPRIVGPAAW